MTFAEWVKEKSSDELMFRAGGESQSKVKKAKNDYIWIANQSAQDNSRTERCEVAPADPAGTTVEDGQSGNVDIIPAKS